MNGEHAQLARELETQRLRTAVALEVSPQVWEHLDDVSLVAGVVEDIVDRWIRGRPDRGEQPLVGSGGFTDDYLATVEHDFRCRPWWQFCSFDARHELVVDRHYKWRVWSHHAGWLRCIHPTTTTTAVPDPLPAGPDGQLVVERLRTEAAIEVAAAISDWPGNDVLKVTAVVDDVVANWLKLTPAERAGLGLTGVHQFADQYVTGVLYEREDPDGEVYRLEFCPPDEDTIDLDCYSRAVWNHHVQQLAQAR